MENYDFEHICFSLVDFSVLAKSWFGQRGGLLFSTHVNYCSVEFYSEILIGVLLFV